MKALAGGVLFLCACACASTEEPPVDNVDPTQVEGFVRLTTQYRGVTDFVIDGSDAIVLAGSLGAVNLASGAERSYEGFAGQNLSVTKWVSIARTPDALYVVTEQTLCTPMSCGPAHVLYRSAGGAAAAPVVTTPAEGESTLAFPPGAITPLGGGWLVGASIWDSRTPDDSYVEKRALFAWRHGMEQPSRLLAWEGDYSARGMHSLRILDALLNGLISDKDGVLWFRDGGMLSTLELGSDGARPTASPVRTSEAPITAFAPHPEGGLLGVFYAFRHSATASLVRVLENGAMEILLDVTPGPASRLRIHDGYAYISVSQHTPEGLFRSKERIFPAGVSSELP